MAKRIDVAAFINTPFAVATEDGQKLGARVSDLLRAGEAVILDFGRVESVTSSFANPAIGMLYRDLTSDVIESYLTFQGTAQSDDFLLARVKERAREYYRDPSKFAPSLDEVVTA